MNSAFILGAIRRHCPTAAVVPEITIEDYDLPDTEEVTEYNFTSLADRPEGHKYTRRIDALMFDSLVRTAFEIKVTREDFQRDTYWKRRMWQRHTHRFIYVVPHGLDVMSPHGCGLWKVSEDGRITVVKKAIVSKTPEPLPQSVVQRIAYRAAKNSSRAHSKETP
ncbi:hypothetical protein ACT17_06375 [Mycolicibacterium conceptionense]|uniref:Uncharacterized protein n=1 Tax=Mycolicibacterium conceptionense TaxID=451644 RepID=A0A0J8UFH3_9MYCO|nr:hypothetical protein [Mycolicibacterium conceptionense]KMV19657.1 hypothetical protein ACT17_06375 [Mycolicibacterium conceptionense]